MFGGKKMGIESEENKLEIRRFLELFKDGCDIKIIELQLHTVGDTMRFLKAKEEFEIYKE